MEEFIRQISHDKLEEICHRYHVVKLSVFGSVANGEPRPDSDIDMLVEFVPGKVPGFAFSDLQDELTDIVGRRVDLRTSDDLSKYFRGEVIKEAQPIYAG